LNLICFIIVILIGFPVILVFADSEIEDELLNEGNVLFTQGKYFEALTYYDQILNLNPEHEIAKNNLMESFDPQEMKLILKKFYCLLVCFLEYF